MGDPTQNVSIVGTWRLVRFQSRIEDGPALMGEHPDGLLIYTRTGWMAVHISHAERQPFVSSDPLLATQGEQARAFATSFITYCGRYEVIDDRVRHHVEVSVHPNWKGVVLERSFTLDGDTLVLRTPPHEFGGKVVSSELRWRRVG
jgi:hypothetical protein